MPDNPRFPDPGDEPFNAEPSEILEAWGLKICSKCKRELPLSRFYRNAASRDRYRPSCSECDLLNRDVVKRRAYEKEYWGGERKQRKTAITKRSMTRNKEHHAKVRAIYRQTEQFKALHRKHAATRRARVASAFVEEVDYASVYAEADGYCEYCHKPLEFHEVEFDHYIPIAKSGKHARYNIRVSCTPCNRSKAAKLPWGVCH